MRDAEGRIPTCGHTPAYVRVVDRAWGHWDDPQIFSVDTPEMRDMGRSTGPVKSLSYAQDVLSAGICGM